MKILLVEDSDTTRKLISAYVRELGYEAIEARSARDALDIYHSGQPDLVLTDIEMPGMNGYELAAEMRRSEPKNSWVPIVFLSSRVGDEDIARGVDAGGDDYLTKPVSRTVLGAKLKAMHRITEMRRRLLVVSHDLRVANRELLKLSTQDGLTGLANRRSFDAALQREWRRGQLSGDNVGLVLCDIDHFKRFNDGYGHDHGDHCLRQVAGAIQDASKAFCDSDNLLIARYGGEEFVALVPQRQPTEVHGLGEALLLAVRKLQLAHAYSSTAATLTISVGVSCGVPDIDAPPETLLQCADRALYEAKAGGRNCCCFSTLATATRPVVDARSLSAGGPK